MRTTEGFHVHACSMQRDADLDRTLVLEPLGRITGLGIDVGLVVRIAGPQGTECHLGVDAPTGSVPGRPWRLGPMQAEDAYINGIRAGRADRSGSSCSHGSIALSRIRSRSRRPSLALNHTAAVWHCFRSWLRTMNPAIPPSELIVANALRSSSTTFFPLCALAPELRKIVSTYYRQDLPRGHRSDRRHGHVGELSTVQLI